MLRDWNTMSHIEKGEVIRKVIYFFEEEDMRVSKIAYDEVDLPYEIVHGILMEYLSMIDKLDEKK